MRRTSRGPLPELARLYEVGLASATDPCVAPDREEETEMDRVKFIDHRGNPILLSDLSGIRDTSDLQRVVRLGTELLQAQPHGSTLVLVDVTDVEYNLEAFAVLQQSVAVNRPFVRARAIVGLPSNATIPFQIVESLSQSPMARFDSREAAQEWLISQA